MKTSASWITSLYRYVYYHQSIPEKCSIYETCGWSSQKGSGCESFERFPVYMLSLRLCSLKWPSRCWHIDTTMGHWALTGVNSDSNAIFNSSYWHKRTINRLNCLAGIYFIDISGMNIKVGFSCFRSVSMTCFKSNLRETDISCKNKEPYCLMLLLLQKQQMHFILDRCSLFLYTQMNTLIYIPI